MARKYLPRVAETTLKRYLQRFPVIGVTGPRQSGKSTFLQHELPDYTYVTFDDLTQVDFFEDDPLGFIAQWGHRVIFDEVQYVPNLLRHLKIIVDQNRETFGQFVLTCSAQFSFLKNVSESLAGRIGLFEILPLQFSEIPKKQQNESIYLGSYPELVKTQFAEQQLWYSAYLDTYLNKDLRVLTQIGDLREFRRFLYLLAANITETLDMTYYARDIGVAVPTIKRWISILEASYVIFLLPPFYNNLGKRIIKSPKVYFYDTGLACYLLGLNEEDRYERGPKSGEIFENYIVSEILKREKHNTTHHELFYFRSSDQYEIDLILDKRTSVEFIEIKKSSTLTPAMIKTIAQFKPDEAKGILIYQGKSQRLANNIQAVNYKEYLAG